MAVVNTRISAHVVGGGIIGIMTAFELVRRGCDVTVVEAETLGRGASFGNMASVAVSEFMAASSPTVWRKIPGWMLDRDAPIRVRLTYLPKALPWLWRFVRAGRAARIAEIEAAGHALSSRVYDDLLPILREAGLSQVLSNRGCLRPFFSEAEFLEDRGARDLLDRFGVSYETLGAHALNDIEPGISPRIIKAVLLPSNRTVADPYRLVVDLAAAFQRCGGRIVKGKVVGFQRTAFGNVDQLQIEGRPSLPCGNVVVAAGVHTAPLADLLGEPIPLETERGYHTQIMAPGFVPNHSFLSAKHAFMISPTAGGIRIGGTVEMAGLHAAPDYRRARVLLRRAREILPALKFGQTSEWMGHRPAMPDAIPVISRSGKAPNVFYATGHGHLGLTHAAPTARLIADLLTDCPTPIDMRPYSIGRFD